VSAVQEEDRDTAAAVEGCRYHLDAILGEPPEGTGIILWRKDTKQHEAFATVAQAAARAIELDRSGAETYVSTALIRIEDWRKPTRTNASVAARKCFHVDVDVGKGSATYLAAGPAAAAVRDWARRRGLLPGMTVMTSGAGLHIYWSLEEAVTPDRWREMAAQLDTLLRADGVLADHAVTCDASRLLRPAGTRNHKNAALRPVTVVLSEGLPAGLLLQGAVAPWATVSAEDFREALAAGVAAVGGMPVVPSPVTGMLPVAANDLTGGLPPRPESDDAVAWVQRRLDAIPPDCDYTTWRDVVFGLHSTGWKCAHALALAWSERSPAFDVAAFTKLWESAKPTGAGVTLGSVDAVAKRYGFVDEGRGSRAVPLGTDLWHAEQFARAYQGRLVHVHSSSAWASWTGNNWEWCERGEATQALANYVRGLTERAYKLSKDRGVNDAEALAAFKDAQRVASARTMNAVLSLASNLPALALASPAAFDADPWLLGVTNGAVNLRTGQLLQADPAMMIMRTCGAAFDADAACPQWLAFLGQVFHEDADTIHYIQRLCGLFLTGDVSDEVLHFMHGHGANGKSVFANVLRHVLGSYCYVAQADLLVKDDRRGTGAPSPDIVNMAGARLVLVNETGAGDRLDEVRMKSLASTEAITARTLYGSPFTFRPSGKILVRGNFKPIVQSSDHGTWRRLRLVAFTKTFTPEECDPHTEARLTSEADGILQWMLQGVRLWQRCRLRPSGAIARASAAYRDEMDLLKQWMDDACDTNNAAAEGPQGALFSSYELWCQRAGVRSTSRNAFSRELAARGFEATRKQRGGARQLVHLGITLLPTSAT
jgi:P4 family phage/plasmid primase-like protien